MYIVVKENQIIAAHDDLEIVSEYVTSQSNSDGIRILEVKKKKTRELKSIPDFEDIYLVRYGSFYVPYDQYCALKDIGSQRDYDLKYCKDILFRLLEEDTIDSKKDIAAIQRTISLVMSEIEQLDSADYDKLEELKISLHELNGGH